LRRQHFHSQKARIQLEMLPKTMPAMAPGVSFRDPRLADPKLE
jgi:hypothetical protein